MLILRADDFTEKQLAEIGLAIQNRWEVPTFVKMHEIVVVEEDVTDRARQELNTYFEKGLASIFQNLGLSDAFKFVKTSKTKYVLERIPGSTLPRWMIDIEAASKVPENVFECPHCVLPDTLILGDNKPIIEYDRGNASIGQTGLNHVTQKYARSYNGEVITIKAMGMLPVTTTPEHLVLTSSSHLMRKRLKGRLLTEIKFSGERWLPAKDLAAKKPNIDGDYLVIPIIKGDFGKYEIDLNHFIIKAKPRHKGYRRFFPLTEDTVWLLGLFVSEGSVTREVRFSLNINEKEIRERIVEVAKGLGYSTNTRYLGVSNSMLVTIPSRVLARAFDSWCGRRAANKRIPDFVLFHKDLKIVKAFLLGYETGDGHNGTKKPRKDKIYRTCSTVSRLLVQQLQLAYARLRIWASIDRKPQSAEGIIIGRRVSLHTRYNISYVPEPNVKRMKVRFLEDMVLCPIRQVSKQDFEGNVYNIETSDNTYLVSNAIVHNCGRHFQTDLELSMHTKLHYLI